MKKILFGLMLLMASGAFSQLSTIDLSMSFVTNPPFTAGLDEVSQQGIVFQVKVSVNDLNDVGELTVMVSDFATNSPIAIKRLEKAELLTGTYTQNGLIVFNFPYLDPGAKYKVILEAQNSLQAYLPRIEKNFPSN